MDDARTLPVRYEMTGERFRTFDEAVLQMYEEEFEEQDWPLEGPRSALWWMRSTRRMGLTPATRHSKWVHENSIPASDRSVYEHEVLSQALEYAATIDQINVPSLLSLEYLLRRLQLIEEAHALAPTGCRGS